MSTPRFSVVACAPRSSKSGRDRYRGFTVFRMRYRLRLGWVLAASVQRGQQDTRLGPGSRAHAHASPATSACSNLPRPAVPRHLARGGHLARPRPGRASRGRWRDPPSCRVPASQRATRRGSPSRRLHPLPTPLLRSPSRHPRGHRLWNRLWVPPLCAGANVGGGVLTVRRWGWPFGSWTDVAAVGGRQSRTTLLARSVRRRAARRPPPLAPPIVSGGVLLTSGGRARVLSRPSLAGPPLLHSPPPPLSPPRPTGLVACCSTVPCLSARVVNPPPPPPRRPRADGPGGGTDAGYPFVGCVGAAAAAAAVCGRGNPSRVWKRGSYRLCSAAATRFLYVDGEERE